MKAYIVVQDDAGREIHMDLSAAEKVRTLIGSESIASTGLGARCVLSRIGVTGHYAPEFRQQAVERYLTGAGTVKETALQLGIPHQTLDKWIRDRCGTTVRAFLRPTCDGNPRPTRT